MRKFLILFALILAVALPASAQTPSLEGHVTSTMTAVKDANGVSSALQVSTAGVKVAGTFETTGALTQTGAVTQAGTFQLNNTFTMGVDGTGYDAKFFGDTASAYMLWDESADDLVFGAGAAVTAIDDWSVTAVDDVSILGGSAGSVLNIGTNVHGNIINIGTNNTAKDQVNVGSVLDDIFIGSNGSGVEAATGNVCSDRCLSSICQTTCTLTAVAVAVTDPGAAAAYGGVKIYDFPPGFVNRLGIVADITLTEASATIDPAFDGDISFGSTVGEATATLHNPTTEDDWVLTSAITQAVTSVAAADAQSAVTEQTICDGHTTACDLYLNVEIDDADITTGAADEVTVDGTITITWINLGDNG